MISKFMIPILVISIVTLGCGPQTPPVTLDTAIDVSIDAPLQARLGDKVPVTVSAKNVLNNPIFVYHQGETEHMFDIVVKNERGEIVWSEVRGVAEEEKATRFQSHETKQVTFEWDISESSPACTLRDRSPYPKEYCMPPAGAYFVAGIFEAYLRSQAFTATPQTKGEAIESTIRRIVIEPRR